MKPGNCCSRGVQKVARTLQDLLTIPTPQIIVARHAHRKVPQPRPEQDLGRAVEGIGIDEGDGHAPPSARSGVIGLILKQPSAKEGFERTVLNAPVAMVEVANQLGSLQPLERGLDLRRRGGHAAGQLIA